MIPRLVTVAIFAFCGVMTTLLVRSVLIPEESRLAEIAPNIPFDLFAARTEGSTLDIWEGNRITGRCELSPMSAGLSALDRHEKIKVKLEVLLRLKNEVMGSSLIELSGNGILYATGRVEDLDLELILHGSTPQLRLAIKEQAGQPLPALRLTRGNDVVFESGNGAAGNELVQLMLQSGGVPLDFLSDNAGKEAPTSFRKGRIEAGGESFVGYLLSSGASPDQIFRLYMANTGEILRIATPLGLEMLSETLRPKGTAKPNLERYPAKASSKP